MSFRSITIKRALDHLSRNDYVLPAIQREFVWSSEQIGRLFDSLLRGYPIGTFLFWNVPPELSREFRFYGFMREYHELKSRHSPPVAISDPRTITAILDGQQRLTALNIGLLGYLATRKKYGRATSLSAYPQRSLYVDLEFDPNEADDDALYRFEFLTDEDARHAGGAWFRVGDVLDLGEGPSIFRWIQRHGLAEHPTAFETLDSLWRAVHTREAVSFFEEDTTELDRVLEIFIRTNSGGTVLSKSDLLLSVATAQFTQLDARSAVHNLVDDLNGVGQGFNFTKDNVLKAGLMITDRADIRFQVKAFTAENVAALESNWERIDRAVRVAVQLLASFGFSVRTLSAASVMLPVADYLAHRNLGEEYLKSPGFAEDRERVRRWVTRGLLKQGIWGSGLDTLLTRLRRAIRAAGGSAFPEAELNREMAGLAKAPILTNAELEELVETPIGNRRAFPLLALLYPGVGVRNEFHIDHVFPRSAFAARQLTAAGVSGDLHDTYQDLRDRLPNLQLLEGPINVSKNAMPPAQWVRRQFPDEVARSGWLAAHDLTQLPEGLGDFFDFYERRREAMLKRLRRLLGEVEDGEPPPPPPPPPQSVSPPAEREAPSASWPTPPSAAREPRKPVPSGSSAQRRHIGRSLFDLPDGPITFRHRGTEHRAEVVAGRIILSDGRPFESPSNAAKALNGGSEVNGWKAWKRGGRTIGEIVDERVP